MTYAKQRQGRPRSSLAGACAWLSVLAVSASNEAGAQEQAQPQPTEAAPAAAPDAPAAAPVSPELAARVDEALREAQLARRELATLQEQLAKAKEPSTATADAKGFNLRSADGAYWIGIHTLLQVDSRWFLDNGDLANKADTFLIRKLRPSFDGKLLGIVSYRFTPDFAGGSAAVLDAFADISPFPWLHLVAGKLKSPLGLERLQSDADIPFIERALTQNLTPQRDIGVALWGEILQGLLVYHAGIYNGNADGTSSDLDSNHAKDFVGRLLVRPFKPESLRAAGDLGLHFAASTGNRLGRPTSAQLPSFRSGGQQTIFSYSAPSSDATGINTPFAHLRQTRINPGIFYYYGPVGVLGEYVWSKQGIQKGNTVGSLKHQAAHATLSFVIGGKNGYGGATPDQNLDLKKGTWGALEIAVRWNWLKLDDSSFGDAADPAQPFYAEANRSVSKAHGFGGAVSYLASRAVRIAVNFEQSRFSGGLGTDRKNVLDRTTENVIIGRLQLNF